MLLVPAEGFSLIFNSVRSRNDILELECSFLTELSLSCFEVISLKQTDKFHLSILTVVLVDALNSATQLEFHHSEMEASDGLVGYLNLFLLWRQPKTVLFLIFSHDRCDGVDVWIHIEAELAIIVSIRLQTLFLPKLKNLSLCVKKRRKI